MKRILNQARFILMLLIAFYSSTIFSKGHVVFQLGANQGNIGKTQQIAIQDLIGDTFTSDNKSSTNVLLGLGYYLDGHDFGRIKMSYGINGFYLPKLTATGKVTQENVFTNLSYSYQVENFPVYLMAKSIINLNSSQYALTIDAGIGPNFMHAYAFDEQSLDGGITIPDSVFSSHTTTNLSGTFGVGFRMNNVNQLSFELGYRFFYLGQGHFTTSNSQVLDTVKTGNVYTNAVVLTIAI